MRILPILTASMVAVSLGMLVLNRDAVFSLVGREPASTETREETGEVAPPASAGVEAGVVPVVAMPSSAQKVATGIPLRGNTEAARYVELQSETSGLVVTEPLRKGSSVEEGQIVCELDPGTRGIELEEARTNLRDAENDAFRANELANEGFGTETNRIAAEAAVLAAKLAVERAEKEIKRLRIRAPFSGLLESDAAEIGSLLQRGSLCATIIQLDPIKLVGHVAETDVDKIATGRLAQARLINGHEVTGAVSFISRTGDPATKTFRTEITVDNKDLAIRDGTSVEILIDGGMVGAHLIPKSSLTLNDAGRLGVQTVNGGTAKFMPVDIVRDSVQGVWVSGLPDEIDVIVVGHEYVIDGSAINPRYRAG